MCLIIYCVIKDITIEKALLDLGASVNVLLSFMYDRFSIGGTQTHTDHFTIC